MKRKMEPCSAPFQVRALNALFSGNIISLFIVGIVQVFLFASVSWLIFRADVFLNPFNIVILLYLLCVIGISIFLSTLLKTRLQLQAGAPLLPLLRVSWEAFGTFRFGRGRKDIIPIYTQDLHWIYSAGTACRQAAKPHQPQI